MRIAGVEYGIRPLARLLRVTLIGVLATLLLMRLGLFCEATAHAATIAPVMAGCEGTGKPDKQGPSPACATPCTAVSGEMLARIDQVRLIAVAFAAAPVSVLNGLPMRPATPPPRAV